MAAEDTDTPALAAAYDTVGQWHLRHALDFIERLGPMTGLAVLDVGCGTGLLAEALAARGATVRGIDPSPFRIAEAAKRRGAMFSVGRAEDLAAFTPASMDLILMTFVADWIADRPTAFAGAVRVLRPGGRLGLIVEAATEVQEPLRLAGFGLSLYEPRTLDTEFETPEALLAFAHASGFGSLIAPPPGTSERQAVADALLDLYGTGNGTTLKIPRPFAWVIADRL